MGPAAAELVERIRALDDMDTMAEVAEDFLRGRRPAPDPLVPKVNRIVARIMDERDITTVADVVSRTGIGERRLQRPFTEYVGATPKWVIRRYRLHEAAERLATAEHVDLAALALGVRPETWPRDLGSRCPRSGGADEERKERPPGRD